MERRGSKGVRSGPNLGPFESRSSSLLNYWMWAVNERDTSKVSPSLLAGRVEGGGPPAQLGTAVGGDSFG